MQDKSKWLYRRTIRKAGYDYSKPGRYFITICTFDKQLKFGHIVNGEMQLSAFGAIAHDEWILLKERYPTVVDDTFIVMPNHIHGILTLENYSTSAEVSMKINPTDLIYEEAKITVPYLGGIVGAYKSLVAKKCRAILVSQSSDTRRQKLWQRNYYDHIIRDDESYLRISDYIKLNPTQWEKDKFYKSR